MKKENYKEKIAPFFVKVLFLSLFFVLFSISLTLADSAESNQKVIAWVFFTDKGNISKNDIRKKRKDFLRERAGRKRYLGSPNLFDFRDIPVRNKYIEKIEKLGAKKRAVTKWLNGISIEASPDLLEEIKKLKFVKEVKIIRRVQKDEKKPSFKIFQKDNDSFAGNDISASQNTLDYGNSLTQLSQVNVTGLHNLGYTGKGVTICVIDTGFTNDHEALMSTTILAERDFINDDNETANESGDPTGIYDQELHGTGVLSVVGGFKEGKLIGSAYGANFLLAKTEVNESETHTEEDYWLEAIEWAYDKGADIVSSSLAYYDFDEGETPISYEGKLDGKTAIVTKAANIAAEKGMLVVNAVGNERLKAPADGKYLIAVGGVDSQGNVWGGAKTDTDDGRIKPEIVAMGVNVYTAYSSSMNSYAYKNGTSYATPIVAGLSALLLEAHPDWSYSAVREAIITTSSNADSPNSSSGLGYGIPDAVKALSYDNLLTITSTAGANGEIFPSGAIKVGHNAMQSYTISPSDGYHIAKLFVDGSEVDVAETYKFESILSDHTISATFESNNITILTTKLPKAHIKKKYKAKLKAEGGSGKYIWTVVKKKLPSGLKLTKNGTIKGKPKRKTRGKKYKFTVEAEDRNNSANSASKSLKIKVKK
ncbi:MAG: hypothetical protein D6734_04605 [Candidatus Schekmanbacteria bacterium]|nr:MAG: hypothetical protein D6734_04605 [Candidatus Schekmanbacteria bacterium]